jgi:hypothetical protein
MHMDSQQDFNLEDYRPKRKMSKLVIIMYGIQYTYPSFSLERFSKCFHRVQIFFAHFWPTLGPNVV